MTKADWLDFLKPLMVVQQLKKKLQRRLQQVSFKMTHQQLKLAPVQEAPAQPIFAGA